MIKPPSFRRPEPVETEHSPLPERWKRGRRRAALCCLAAMAILLTLIHIFSSTGWLQVNGGVNGGLDAWWLRERFTLREAVYGSERDSRIIIVGIDDRSLDKWPEPFILWGGHIADAINHLNRSGARVIALDWTQTTDVDQVFHIRNDEKLGAALNSAKGIVLVKILRPDGKYVYPVDSLRYALPNAANDGGESSLGYADVPSPTGIWTYIYPTIPGSGGRDVSFAARIAQKADSIDPTDVKVGSDGTMFVRFKGGTGFTEGGTFERVSLYDVATAKSPDPRWKDKIVLIGATYKGGNDNHYVPIMNGVVAISDLRLIPGVEAQAHAVATILDDAAIQEPPPMAIWLLAGFAGILGVGAYTQWNWGRAAFVMLGVLLGWTALSFVVFCTDNFALPLVAPLSTLLLGAAMMGGYRALSEERERAQVLRVWGKHKDPRIILELLEHPEWRGGEGEEVEVTVLFADLKNFTKTVEHLPPARALEVLNRYLALVSESIKKQGGVVDKYLGDGLMAQWGAPVPRQDHADAAVAACLDINERLCTLSEELEGTGEIVFETRLTLHSGLVVAGNVGSDESLEYTIIGDTVNVTSRMQETAKQLDANFLISETTQASLKQPVALGRRSEVEIRGRQRPLVVHEVLCRAIKSPEVISPSKNGKESQEEHGGVTTAAETV